MLNLTIFRMEDLAMPDIEVMVKECLQSTPAADQ